VKAVGTPPTRQTQAPRKRGDDTRARIIDETVRCVVEEGFEASTAKHVADTISEARTPVFYLEIPPFLFGTVIKGLHEAGLTDAGRVGVEKPFGRSEERRVGKGGR